METWGSENSAGKKDFVSALFLFAAFFGKKISSRVACVSQCFEKELVSPGQASGDWNTKAVEEVAGVFSNCS